MKTKIGAAVIALLFLMACGSDQPKQEEQNTTAETQPSGNKFILKAANMMYIAVQPDSTLKASQPDPTKADVFERVDLGDGKTALKTANGRYVTDNRAGSSELRGFCEHASDWEQFEIIALDQAKVNIKASSGKYVSADLGKDGIINASSEHASDWEAFTLEAQ